MEAADYSNGGRADGRVLFDTDQNQDSPGTITGSRVRCDLCQTSLTGRDALVEHLRAVHEPLELAAFAATTMMEEDKRDTQARKFFRELEAIRREQMGKQ